MNVEQIKKGHPNLNTLEISALTGKGISLLKDLMREKFVPSTSKSKEVILHFRQKLLLESIYAALKLGRKLLMEGYSEEICVEEIRKAAPLIGELTGEIRNDDILKEIFKSFCVGK